ncbi:TonB-dependent receptor [Ningiella sp. W23]|uniref:TonB-dependent receptor n=1 Tax=Ningiella sp. W23 TaxID=3023715 RepID=UPI0037567CFA
MHTHHTHNLFRRSSLAIFITSALLATNSFAQDADTSPEQEEEIEVIEVLSIADAYRNAIAEKRNAATIVDALSSADMGALPDLSVAETLERITGVTGDRFKGNASEISIRGLGPFLGLSTVNGRAISSGSGNRSVAFSQFPSELVNGVTVFKAQKADLLEGGVSGTINLKTIKPIDYGKERFQAEMRLNYNPYHSKQDGEDGVGYRPTISYTNAFDLEDGGKFGFAIGYAGADISSPEESYNTSSTLRNCNSDFGADGGSNCSFRDANAAANGGEAVDGDYYFIPNAFFYRQMKSEEDRDAMIFALQYQPNSDLDINIDGQWSSRYYFEDRHDLLFDDGRRRIANWETNDEGALLAYSGNSRISSYGEYRVRDEDYRGLGLNVDWSINDRLGAELDVSYSGTERYQTRTYTRFRSDRFYYDWQNQGSDNFGNVSQVYSDFDDPNGSSIDWLSNIQDLSFFDANSEARNYRFDIEDSIAAYRVDFDYLLYGDLFTEVKFGAIRSLRAHDNFQEERRTLSTPSAERDDKLAAVAANCGMDFEQSDYGDDANSPVSQWATYDTRCAYDTLVGINDLSVDPRAPSAGDVRLTETLTAFYAMVFFSTEIGDVTVDGNFGVRQVNTDIESVGTRNSYSIQTDPEGNVIFNENSDAETNILTNDFSNTLPSLNINFGLTDDVQLRFAAYSALSRPDMWYYGSGRRINGADSSDEFQSVEEALQDNVTALGNPFLEALESDNLDLSLNYFMGQDTLLSAALYYKSFNARFDIQSDFEDVVVDGQTFNVEVNGRPTILDDSSSIKGIELTVQHRFSELPSPFDGLGVVLNYNYADSDFETPEAGSAISDDVLAVIPPANIAGLSDTTLSSQLYWENDDFSARLSYKFRSEYLKPFGPNLAQTNRFVDDQSTLDLDLSYNITKRLITRFQIINITNNPYVEQRVAREAFNRIEYSGPRFFLGLRYRL